MRVICFLAALAAAWTAFAQTPAVRLKLSDATALALRNHPQIQAAQAESSAEGRRITETKAAYYPTVDGEVTGSGANHLARIGAGFLSDSSLFNRFGDGVEINQLISDFGRTSSLVAQSKLLAASSAKAVEATRYDILLRVNQAYYSALRAQALVKVATETVSARQLSASQIGALAQNKLKSDLDVKFADVILAQANLLMLRSQNAVKSAFAELTRAMGDQRGATYELTDEPLPPSPAPDAETLVVQALQTRPELAGLRLDHEAALKFVAAERDLKRPVASFIGEAGYMPYIDQITLPRVIPGEYAGAAVNLQIPIFNGHLFTARRQEAEDRATAADLRVRDLEESVARDVRTAWASAQSSYQALDVTAQFLREATQALDLAKGRFDLGLSDIVALTQAQLNLTEAEIENLNAKYDYQSLYAALQYSTGALR
jgi:outer membrane protein